MAKTFLVFFIFQFQSFKNYILNICWKFLIKKYFKKIEDLITKYSVYCSFSSNYNEIRNNDSYKTVIFAFVDNKKLNK
jgi:hypothetical protein